MSIGNKEVYPFSLTDTNAPQSFNLGLTYREWLIGMALSNPNLVVTFQGNDDRYYPDIGATTENIKLIIDAIIKQLDKESK